MCLTSLSQRVIFQIELVGLCDIGNSAETVNSNIYFQNLFSTGTSICEFELRKHQFYSNLRQSCKFSGTNQAWTNQWRPLGHVDQKMVVLQHPLAPQPVLNNAALVIDESLWICRTCNLQKTEALAVYPLVN